MPSAREKVNRLDAQIPDEALAGMKSRGSLMVIVSLRLRAQYSGVKLVVEIAVKLRLVCGKCFVSFSVLEAEVCIPRLNLRNYYDGKPPQDRTPAI